MVNELDTGIRVYLNAAQGFTGIFKQRFSDFCVTEVDLNGDPARVCNKTTPAPLTERSLTKFLDIPSIIKEYKKILGDTNAKKSQDLEDFLNQISSSDNPELTSLELDCCDDKERRKEVHELFRNCPCLPPVKTEVSTASCGRTSNGSLAIHLSVCNKLSPKGNRRDREPWPGGKGNKYLKFCTKKINKDTISMLATLSKLLHVSVKTFSYAGTKDKRGVTSQWMTAYQIRPETLLQVEQKLHGIEFGNFSYTSEQLHLGDLSGNIFKVILRGVEAKEGVIEAAVTRLQKSGFLNYFGLQRFGSGTLGTHHVGELLIKGDWEGAVFAILAPATEGNEALEAALNEFKVSGKADSITSSLPKRSIMERNIVKTLEKGPAGRYLKALQSNIPKNLQVMYIHAVQSFVWNQMASKRIDLYGKEKVVKGDLVLSREAMTQNRLNTANQKKRKFESIESCNILKPHIVTQEDCDREEYSIFDVVLPLPGKDVIYPQNELSQCYKECLARLGVNGTEVHRVPEFNIMRYSGDYRKLITHVEKIEMKFLHYDDPDEELHSREKTDGRFLAVELEFELPPSSYATMLLRELTKMPTNYDFLKSLKHPT